MIGSLKGVSSQLGFYFFVNDLYPQIIERIAEFKYDFEFRIIGYGKLPSDLDHKLKNLKYVNFLGFVEDVELQYHEADIILVTIPVSHGFRTRIAEAFSYRKCVIAHSANAEGMPEVEHGVNALISNSARDLALMIVQTVNSSQLRDEISSAAINTFNSKISVDVALHKYKSLLYENHPDGIQ
jgi:glycosyltransferase involved in cell wall biosynthesis